MSGKLLYSMGEVAEILGEDTSAVRYWANYFSKYIKPERNAKGNRFFHPEDLEALKTVHFLIKTQGLTLEGAAKRLEVDRKGLDKKMRIVDNLREIKSQLQNLYDNM